MNVMDKDDADRFLKQAVVCREEADKAINLIEAASWLQLADDFEERARQEAPIKREAPEGLFGFRRGSRKISPSP